MSPLNANDIVYTPSSVAKYVIKRYVTKYDMQGSILDPCKGKGVFYKNYPEYMTKYWCEIQNNRDFFTFKTKVDWIISNPPYSIFRQWLLHSFEVADNIVYLIPVSKVVASKTIMTDIQNYGGIVEILVKWSGRDIGFPFGFPCGIVYIRRNFDKSGKLIIKV